MKTLIRSLFLVGAMLVASSAFAAVDMFLKIEDVKGQKRVVRCADGACTVSDLAPGQYTVSVCLENGSAPPADVAASHTITSPRDTASGQATGKRQHGEVKIIKEWGAASPVLRIAIDQPGTPVVLKVNTSRSNIKSN